MAITLRCSTSFTCIATTSSPVGDYSIIPELGTLVSQNYNFTFVEGTLTVHLAPTASITGVPIADVPVGISFIITLSGEDGDEGGENIVDAILKLDGSEIGRPLPGDVFEVPGQQSPDTYTLTYAVQDNEGVWSAEATETFTVANALPTAEIVPPSGDIYAGDTITVTLVAQDNDENGSSIVAGTFSIDGVIGPTTLYQNGNPVAAGNVLPGQYQLPLPDSIGTHTLRYVVTDDEGTDGEATAEVDLLDAPDISVMMSTSIRSAGENHALIDGRIDTIPASPTLLDEWTPFFVDIWVQCDSVTHQTGNVSLDVLYTTDLVSLTPSGVIYGELFSQLAPPTIDDNTGIAHIEATGQISGTGYALVASLLMIQMDQDEGVPIVDQSDELTTSKEFLFEIESVVVDFDLPADESVSNLPSSSMDMFPVLYDLNDNNRVGITDLAMFASYFGQDVAQATDPLVTAADYNKDGTIGIADLAWFAANFGKVPGDTLLYPENKSSSDTPSEQPATIPIPTSPAATPIAAQTDIALIEELPEDSNNTATQSTPTATNSIADTHHAGQSASPILTPDEADLYFTESEKASTDQSLNREPVDDRLEEELIESLLEQLV